MKIAIGNDHTAIELKNIIKEFVEEKGYEVLDLGTNSTESCDYPVYGEKVGRAVAGGEADLGIVICGTIGAVIQPWVLVDHIGIFLTVTGSLWSTIYGMTISDYILLRKRKLNVPDLYKPVGEGQFTYFKGINPAGILSFILGLIGCLLFPNYAFIVGVIVSAVSYYLLARFWIFKKYTQAELQPGNEKFTGISDHREWLYNEDTNTVCPSK